MAMATSIADDWSTAIQQLNLDRVQQLLQSQPSLLWIPLVHINLEHNVAHVIDQLQLYRHLGSSFENLSAIPYTLLQYKERPGAVSEDTLVSRLLALLLEHASLSDLGNQRWGNGNNTVLHLVGFLGHEQIAEKLLDAGVAADIPNDLGYLPSDVALDESMARRLSQKHTRSSSRSAKREPNNTGRVEGARPNYATLDRFQQLRELAEKTNQKKMTSTREVEGRYFKPGHVAESKRKVLGEEEAELEKQRTIRQQEVARLAQRSAVKNNPLFKRLEPKQAVNHSTGIAVPPESSPDDSDMSVDTTEQGPRAQTTDKGDTKPKRNSKVISSLRDKSYVSTSIFLQANPPATTNKKARSILQQEEKAGDMTTEHQVMPDPISDEPEMMVEYTNTNANINSTEAVSETETASENILQNLPIQSALLTENTTGEEKDTDEQEIQTVFLSEPRMLSDAEAEQLDQRRLSGSQKAHWSIGMNSWSDLLDQCTPNEPSSAESASEDEQWFDSHEDAVSRHSVLSVDTGAQVNAVSDSPDALPTTLDTISDESVSPDTSLESPSSPSLSPVKTDMQTDCLESATNESSLAEENYGSIFVSSTSRYVRRLPLSETNSVSKIESTDTNTNENESGKDWVQETHPQQEPLPQQSPLPQSADQRQDAGPRQKSRSQTKTRPSQEAHSRQETRTKETKAKEKRTKEKHPKRAQTIAPRIIKIQPIARKTNLQEPKPKGNPRHGYGKLYLRINAASDIILPLPKEPTHVRCVVSDSRYEYMSRYETLDKNVNFDYECIIDTFPDMIVSISLHIKPEYHLRSRTPITRLFSSSRSRKPNLADYIYPDDGSIGRTRFALLHMMRGCYKRPYTASFDCFNAWSSRKLHGGNDELKVIGALDVEMLYLPVSDPSTPIPRNLRDCDMAIKLQSWNETFKSTEHLTTGTMAVL